MDSVLVMSERFCFLMLYAREYQSRTNLSIIMVYEAFFGFHFAVKELLSETAFGPTDMFRAFTSADEQALLL